MFHDHHDRSGTDPVLTRRRIGEVIVRIRGGAEHFLAHPASPKERIEVGTVVMVMEHLPPRTVYVTAAYDS